MFPIAMRTRWRREGRFTLAFGDSLNLHLEKSFGRRVNSVLKPQHRATAYVWLSHVKPRARFTLSELVSGGQKCRNSGNVHAEL